MTISLFEFGEQLFTNPPLFVTVLLTLLVILVNGWTDAPNAIATCVATGCLKLSSAILLAAVFNFLGVFFMTTINAKVAQTIFNMVDFGGNSRDALVALCAALFSIILWATAAWAFGIPTSESNALIAGIAGSAIALQGGLSGINPNEWVKILFGLAFATMVGFCSGYLVTNLVEFICKDRNPDKTNNFFKNAQILGAASMAFMHGAQDGQKFMGVFMLGIFLARGNAPVSIFYIPVWLMILCSIVMALGTSIGGYKIIKTVAMDMVKLEKYQGFAADMAASATLLISSATGIPVSTTHTKTTAIMGAGASRGLSLVNLGIVKEMVLAWILTFPGCGFIGYIMAVLFMHVF